MRAELARGGIGIEREKNPAVGVSVTGSAVNEPEPQPRLDTQTLSAIANMFPFLRTCSNNREHVLYVGEHVLILGNVFFLLGTPWSCLFWVFELISFLC